MKKRSSILACLLLSGAALAEPVVTISLDKSGVQVGEAVTALLALNDFPLVEGGGLNVKFDPQVLQVSQVSVDADAWNTAVLSGAVDNNAGTIRDLVFASFAGNSGTAPVATIQFVATGKGRTQISLDSSGLNPFASDGRPIEVLYQNETLSVGVQKGKDKGNRKNSR
jgi:hypothetical protein